MEDETHNVCQEGIYKRLFYQYGEKLFQFLYAKYANEDLARDCMQEAFIVLWENCKKVTYSSAKSYVFTVGRNRAVDFLRKEKLHLTIATDDKTLIQEESIEEDI